MTYKYLCSSVDVIQRVVKKNSSVAVVLVAFIVTIFENITKL